MVDVVGQPVRHFPCDGVYSGRGAVSDRPECREPQQSVIAEVLDGCATTANLTGPDTLIVQPDEPDTPTSLCRIMSSVTG